jgi:NAD(P)-dependent dehydrogenase (short-subunit alcohol dehydrogenase family)
LAAPVALVTGASRGIGRQAAVRLARSGFDVAMAARTLKEGEGLDDSDGAGRHVPGSLESTASLVAREGRRALPARMDLQDHRSIEEAVDSVMSEWGRIDVLVNNAVSTAQGSMTRFMDLELRVLEEKLRANVVSQFLLVKLVVPGMLHRGGGTIVNVTSAVATTDPPSPAGEGGWGMAYAMSKAAFHRMAGILAVELGPRGIRAFNVEPGFVLTERMAVNQAELGFEGVYRGAPPSVPASVIAWLAADPAAGELNGTTISAQRVALERGLHEDWRSGR